MNRQQTIQQLEEMIADYQESIRAIKGKQFTDVVGFLAMSMHTIRLVSMMIDEDVPKEATEMLGKQFASLVSLGVDAMAGGMSSEEVKEAQDWAVKIDGRIEDAMSQLNRG